VIRQGGAWLLLISMLLSATLPVTVVNPAHAYMGGPVRAHIAGLESTRQRVFYYFIFHDESTSTPQVWFFDLNGEEPARPVRVLSLEGGDDGIGSEKTGISDAWRAFSPGLTQLPALTEFDLGIHLTADSSGRDPNWLSVRYNVDLELVVEGASRDLDLVTFCDNVIRVRGVYEIPGRREVVAVLSYKGRAYGCEEVDLPLLLNSRVTMGGSLRSREEAADDESPAQELVAGGRIKETRDQYAPVTWYTTTRSTKTQYNDNIDFDVEFYYGKGDDGTEFIRLRTAYTEARSDQQDSRPLRYNRIRLTDDAGHYYEIPTGYPYRQVFTGPNSVEVWSDNFLVAPWHWKLDGPGWLGFANSRTIHARFEGESICEFDLTPEQVAGISEIIKHYTGVGRSNERR
jgi:hypothetical protein